MKLYSLTLSATLITFILTFFRTGYRYSPVLLIALMVFSCKPPHEVEDEIPEDVTGAFLVLNEGLFQNNNSTINWFHWHTRQNSSDFFEKKNFFGMGDTGNDIDIYGGKIYVLMNNSHVLHVLNRRTGKLDHQIPLVENNLGASPRNLAFHNGHVYVTAFNGFLYKIDTLNWAVEDKLQLGANPDQVLLLYNELWVSNSGGLVSEGDSTISVVNLSTFTESQKIIVGRNPGSLTTDGVNVYAVSRGDYVDIPSKLVKINFLTKEVLRDEEMALNSVHFFNGKLYKTGYHYETSSSSLHQIDINDFSELSGNLIADLDIQTLYGFQSLTVFGQPIYVFFDARQFIHQGSVTVTDSEFNKLFDFSVGLNPSKIVFNAP